MPVSKPQAARGGNTPKQLRYLLSTACRVASNSKVSKEKPPQLCPWDLLRVRGTPWSLPEAQGRGPHRTAGEGRAGGPVAARPTRTLCTGEPHTRAGAVPAAARCELRLGGDGQALKPRGRAYAGTSPQQLSSGTWSPHQPRQSSPPLPGTSFWAAPSPSCPEKGSRGPPGSLCPAGLGWPWKQEGPGCVPSLAEP